MAEGSWKGVAAKMAARIESGELAPGARLPSGDELARTLGINRNAAHRAIEELQRKGLVIRRQGSGTVVAERLPRRGCRVALLVDGYSTYHNFPSGDLLRGIQDRLGDDSTLVIGDSKHDSALEGRQLRKLSRDSDGILLYATNLDRPTVLATLLDEGYPIVALDRAPHGVDIDLSVTENRGAAISAVRLLIDRGHKKIAFLGFHKTTFSSVVERFEGYQQAMSDARLPIDNMVRWLPETIESSQTIFSQVMRDTILGLRHGDEGATAVFCVEDALGCATVVACDQLDISIPDDFEVATFHDWHPMTLRTPWNVHRIVQRKYDLGYTAAGLLLDRIASPGGAPKAVRVEADLIQADLGLRESFASLGR